MKHRTFRLLLIFLVLLFVGAAAVQIVLFTDMPRQWVLRATSQQLGMKVTASSLRTEMWGKTTIKDLALSLPMENDPILTIPKLTVSHTSLPLAVLGKSLTLRSVTIEDPNLNIRQNEAGYWNIREFIFHLSEAIGKGTQSKARLPELDIANGTVSVTRRGDRTENIKSVRFHGGSKDGIRWDFEMDVPSRLTVSGKLATSADWAHEINFNVSDINDIVRTLVPDAPKSLSVSGRICGHVHEDELRSKLELKRLRINRVHSHGTFGIDITTEEALVHLENLLVEGLGDPVEKIRIGGGVVQLDTKQLQAKNVLVETSDVLGSIAAQWHWTEKEGTLAGSWTTQTGKSEIRHQGTWNASINWPKIGPRKVNVQITTQGNSPWTPWQGEVNIHGSGSTWSTSQWKVTVPRLLSQWKGTDVFLEDVCAEIAANWPKIRLESLSAANAEQLQASGVLLANDLSWALSVEAEGLRPTSEQSSPINLSLNAAGNREGVTVKQLKVTHRGLRIEAGGHAALPSTELSDTHVKAFWTAHPDDNRQTLGEVSGDFQCQATMTGTLSPSKFQLQSVLSGKNVTLNNKAIPPIEIPLRVRIEAERTVCETEPFQLFGGTWGLKAEHNFSQKSTQLTLDANEVLLQSMMELFHLPLKCQGSVASHLEIELPWRDMNEVTLSGKWSAKDMIVPPIETDRAEGQIRIQGGTARLEQIRLKRDQGIASASVWFHLNRPDRVFVEVTLEKWPKDMPNRDMNFLMDGKGLVVLDLVQHTGQGQGTLSTDVVFHGKELGHLSAEITAEGRTVFLKKISVDALSGRADGMATIPLDEWMSSQMELQWHDMDLATLADHWKGLQSLAGRSSGSLTIARAEGPRPLEPLRVQVSAEVFEGIFRAAHIGDFTLSGYLGKQRLLIDRSEFKVMNGTLSASGYLRRHVPSGSAYVHAELTQIDLDQLAHFLLPNAKTTQGRLNGTGMLVVLSDFTGMTGQADFQLSESDLGRTTVIGTLYNVMNLKFANRRPTGQGQINIRFEGSSLKIPSFVYFNRGAEIRGVANIDDITQGKASPVKGYAIGSARPLKDIHLPGIRELDQLMASLQSGVSSVRIRGTLSEPKVEAVPLGEIGESLRALLWRQLGE